MLLSSTIQTQNLDLDNMPKRETNSLKVKKGIFYVRGRTETNMTYFTNWNK